MKPTVGKPKLRRVPKNYTGAASAYWRFPVGLRCSDIELMRSLHKEIDSYECVTLVECVNDRLFVGMGMDYVSRLKNDKEGPTPKERVADIVTAARHALGEQPALV